MCGIAGVYALTGKPLDPAWGAQLTRALRHRGPDGEGVFCDERVLLAHTRLAIIDTSSLGAQPMTSGSGRHLITINGEIYNHETLRSELERSGVSFRGHSDTESLIEWLERHGVAGLDAVRGMFAFARYDRHTGDLLLARDRLGKRPLFVTRTPDYLAFASEVRALLTLPFVSRRWRADTAADYLRYLYVPSPRTALEGIDRLPPGCTMTVSGMRPGGRHEVQRYWRIPDSDPELRPDDAWWRVFDIELQEAVRLRTVSDVPIGVFLSGGIDSNLVLQTLQRIDHHPIRTFTIGFEGLPDERAFARSAAARSSDEHVELMVRPSVREDLEATLTCFGEPLGDSAVVTTWLIAREASRHVKVALNGDGGDELFGGYYRYPFACRADLASRVPAALSMLGWREPGRRSVLEAVGRREFAAGARSLSAVTCEAHLEALLRPGVLQAARPAVGPRQASSGLAESVFGWDAEVYLPDDLLIKADVGGMAHAVENRSPLLDHRIVEHVSRLPASRRVHPFRTKPLLRSFARGKVPDEILNAPKRGFQLPIESWLRGPLSAWLDDLTVGATVTAPLYRDGALAREMDAFRSGRGDALAPYRLWGIAALEFWARHYDIEIDA